MGNAIDTLQAALSGRYDITRELGRGGMAVVYLARDKELDRDVALKVLHPDLAASIGSERFLREIEIAAKLTHPHILPVYDRGRAGDFLYYTMPYLDGESLRDRLRREKQLPIDDAVRITTEVADALGYAHSHGIIHRDIKPENILFQGGHAVVADFGIARAVTAAGGEQLTETGLVVGTPAYMSPEQGSGTGELDGRSDLYSLGCVLYEMLSGETPHLGNTPMAIIAKKMSEPAPRISVVRETVPAAVEVALTKTLARNPVDRYATASEFTAALTAEGVTRPQPERRRRRRVWLATAAMAAVIVGIGAWFGITRWRSAPEPVEAAIPIDTAKIAVLPLQVIGADSASPLREQARSIGGLFELKVSPAFGRRIAHPGSVLEHWRAVGGSIDSAVSEERELEIGRQVGAGRVIRGTLAQEGDSLLLAASMRDARDGAIRVPTVRVEGSLEDWYDLVDQLIVQLLARDIGWSDDDVPRLARFEPDAVQAYMAAHWGAAAISDDQNQLFKEAFRLDSNLIDAALWTYASGERDEDTVLLRYALEHQDQLSARAQDYATILAGKAFGTLTGRQVLEAYEELSRRWPEWGLPWAELGQSYFTFGALTGAKDWRRRARDALEPNTPHNEFELFHLAELAFLERDTARARELTEQFAPIVRPGDWITAWPSAYPWRLATLVGDTAGAQLALDSVLSPFAMFAMAYGDGRGIADADRIVADFPPLHPAKSDWPLTRGRFGEFWDEWMQERAWERPMGAMLALYRTLFRDVPVDSTITMALGTLERTADGRDPRASADVRAMAAFWIALWQLSLGDTSAVDETMRRLHDEGSRWGQLEVCALLLEAMRVNVDGGDARAALVRLDSAAQTRPLPAEGPNFFHLLPPEVQNLYLARVLRGVGETERALAASRRRYYGAYAVWVDALPEFLREEGRLAAEVGDTAGAIRAYEHYLALRSDPDPPWRAEWEAVKAELAALVAR